MAANQPRKVYTLPKSPSWLIRNLAADISWSDALLYDNKPTPEDPSKSEGPRVLPIAPKASATDNSYLNDILINFSEDALSFDDLRCTMRNFEEFCAAHEIDSNAIFGKLGKIKEDWQKKKLPRNVQKYLLKISTYIKENNVVKADEMFLKLMMSHASDCHGWSGVIIDLIQSAKKKKKYVWEE